VLHVPIGSKSKYSAANGWKEFLNIVKNANGVSTLRGCAGCSVAANLSSK